MCSQLYIGCSECINGGIPEKGGWLMYFIQIIEREKDIIHKFLIMSRWILLSIRDSKCTYVLSFQAVNANPDDSYNRSNQIQQLKNLL